MEAVPCINMIVDNHGGTATTSVEAVPCVDMTVDKHGGVITIALDSFKELTTGFRMFGCPEVIHLLDLLEYSLSVSSCAMCEAPQVYTLWIQCTLIPSV
jgi:hypothetical protein